MSLNLTSENRQSNYYLQEIDRASQNNLLVSNNMINQVHNVKFYGAVGDGVADDTEAIQACIDANAKMVFLPNGIYRISDDLIINDKVQFGLISDSATLLLDIPDNEINGKYCLIITDCTRFTNSGTLYLSSTNTLNIRPAVKTKDAGNGILINDCVGGSYDNFVILGPFEDGITINSSNDVVNVFITRSIKNVAISNCVVGVRMDAEYYTLNNARISYCRTGVYISGGNNTVASSHCTANRIGIHVLGGAINSDHGQIVGCTLNHNVVCGLFVRDTQFSYSIVGCEIWAQIGDHFGTGFLPVNFENTEVTHATGLTTQYGIYIEDCENINITGCNISRNRVNIAIDGIVTSNISSNIFLSDLSRTSSHIILYGGGHNDFDRNAQNTICNNSFYGNLITGNKRIKFYNNVGSSMNDDSTFVCKNNIGTTGVNYLNLSTADVATTLQVFDPAYEFMILNVTNANVVKLHSALGGSSFVIFITGVATSETKYVELASALTYTAVDNIINQSTGCVYDSGTKRFTFSKNGRYIFSPLGLHVTTCLITGP